MTLTRSQARIKLKFSSTDNRGKLIEALQKAALLEFSTIPPYLTALYSIQDKTSQAFQTLRSVILEEMLHLNLASNLMNSIGGSPQFIGLVPDYPTYIFNINPPSGPYVQLMAASPEVLQDIFMAIEQPAPSDAPPQLEDPMTIGQFYKAIELLFEQCVAEDPNIFDNDTGLQRTDLYFGSGGGKAIYVNSLETAKQAINEIMQQGEGALPPDQRLYQKQQWGAYNYYGKRSDDTYGPILGTPFDLSHYFKFKDLADGTIPIGDTYPMLPNPSPDKFTSPWTRELADLFDGCYGLLVKTLQALFGTQTEPDPYFTVIVPLMQSVFPVLATQLMQLPVLADSDPNVGPNAGPCFQYVDTSLEQLVTQAQQLNNDLQAAATADPTLQSLAANVNTVYQTLEDISGQTADRNLRTLL
ncbi:MAG: ferritin-like protein [Calothrix sp. MO_192.B10]|nr:ferritin-like protein [Calothrix sp. MO_192.B10]